MCVVQDNARVGNAQFYGLLVDMLPTLFIYANLNATFVYVEAPVNAGGALENGAWSGEKCMLCLAHDTNSSIRDVSL